MLTTTPKIVNTIRPPYGKRDELHVVLPCGHACALIPEIHTWTDDIKNVSPSIVCHSGDYHGFYRNGNWS